MIEVFKKFKVLIIIIAVVVVGFIVYTIFTKSPDNSNASLTKTSSENVTAGTNTQANDLAKSFVDQLLTIQSINLKVDFLKDSVFVGLVDNHVDIERQEIGRPNPFAPIGKDNGQSSGFYQDINGAIIPSVNQQSDNGSSNKAPSGIFNSAKDTSGTNTGSSTSTASTTIKSKTNKTQ